MCEIDDATGSSHPPSPDAVGHHHHPSSPITRRQLLHRVGLFTAGALVAPRVGFGSPAAAAVAMSARSASWAANADGHLPRPLAMHLHSSFSEGPASIHAQLDQAASLGFDAVWFSDHDWRMSAHSYRKTVHFDSPTETPPGAPPWRWRAVASGSVAEQGGGFVSSPVSPVDPSPAGSLRVMVRSASGVGAYHFYADTAAARTNLRANIDGQTLQIEVLPVSVGPDSSLELVLALSHFPAVGGRPAGQYKLTYRFSSGPARRFAEGIAGVVEVPVRTGEWNSVTFDPTADIAAIWPDLEARDNSTADLWLGARSIGGAVAEGHFDYLRFDRSKTAGDVPLQVQAEILDSYRSRWPTLGMFHGVEVSKWGDHINWYGGDQHLYQYPGSKVKGSAPNGFFTKMCDLVHSYGGLGSINHPFGTGAGAFLSTADQNAFVARQAARFLAGEAYHADIIEVGYRQRGRMSLESHLALWDVMSQNGYWLTGNGVSDNHEGTARSWERAANRFATYTWAPSSSEADLLAAMASGRVYCGELSLFNGALDLAVDGNPMGSISVRPGVSQRTATITALGLPSTAIVELVQGPVLYDGSTSSRATVVRTFSASELGTGAVSTPVDTSTDSFVRVQVLDTRKNWRTAFTNPVYLLRAAPPTGIPAARRAPDTPA